ncbi:MAG: GWxTD domain-containing protein [Bacteroidales bacterium]|jgi:GWxTD domain-containing protein|nr:GWxTD domain-containing protein [Bacteroidales bacterium]
MLKHNNLQSYLYLFVFICIIITYTNKDGYAQNSSEKYHIYYSYSQDTIFYILFLNTASTHTNQDYFSYNFSVNSEEYADSRMPYSSSIYHAHISHAFIYNSFTIPDYLKQNDSLTITLRTQSNTYATKIPTNNTGIDNDVFLVINNNTFIWNEPFLYQNMTYYFPQQKYIYIINKDSLAQKPTISIHNNSVIPTKTGLFSFYSDSLFSKKPHSYQVVSQTFPRENTACEMLRNCTYVFKSLNYDSLSTTPIGCKLELDKIWLSTQQDAEILKKTISEYYKRIEYANTVYTNSYAMGQDTDFGKVYILCGAPLFVKNNSTEIIWHYSNDTTQSMESITFQKTSNEYESTYQIIKTQSFTKIEETAIQNWKKGRIFSAQNFEF